MISDARSIPDGSSIETEVCVVGTGPAGLALATEFCDQPFRVCVLEAGRFEIHCATQSRARTEMTENDDLYPNGIGQHSMRFGGTANQWCIDIDGRLNVRYTPMDRIDFTKRDWLPHSGWPIGRADLDPYYARAQVTCESGPYLYSPSDWSDDRNKPLEFPSGRLVTKMFQFGPQDAFLRSHRERIEKSENVSLHLNANVIEIETDDTGEHVTAVRVATTKGLSFRVVAKQFVLAMGALETPRLLLLSRRVHKDGLGNQHGLVGRYLNDHQLIKCGRLTPRDPALFDRTGLYDLRKVRGAPVIGKLSLTEETLNQEGLLNIATAIFPHMNWSWSDYLRGIYFCPTTFRSKAHRSARTLVQAFRARRVPEHLWSHLLNIATGLDDLVYLKVRGEPLFKPSFGIDNGGWSTVPAAKRGFSTFDVLQLAEQAPDPENRVTLSDECDLLGVPKGKLTWRWNDIDIRSICRTQDILKEEFAQAGIGDLQIVRRDGIPLLVQNCAHHAAGTTRMATNPREGVVDADCRVHGVSNLYIAGSAVFTTSGYANPTLSIVAIAIRVADRVKQCLESRAQDLDSNQIAA